MNRCLFVATDGSPAAQAALRYALDFAISLRIDEIACLCVHDEDRSNKESIVPAVVGSEMALSTAAGGLMLLDHSFSNPVPAVDPDAVLDACARQVIAAGVRFTPLCGVGEPGDVITRTGYLGQLIFLGRNSDHAPARTHRLGLTTSQILQTMQQNIMVCPAKYARIERLVLALVSGPGDAELVARGATWARALKVPIHVAVSASGPSFSRQSSRAAQAVLANEGLMTSAECYACRPEEYVQTLGLGDLVLVARSKMWRVLQLCFGSSTCRIVQQTIGPAAVIV